MEIITVPFGYLLDWLYQLTNNYGFALILFAIIVQLVMLPITAKSKKGMMKMSRLTPKIQAIKDKYPDDKQKQNEAIQALQREEGAGAGCGGCLWSLVPLLIMIPLYQVVREPIVYLLHQSSDTAKIVVDTIKTAAPELFGKNSFYDQLVAISNIPEHVEAVKAALPDISSRVLEGLNFTFLGDIQLGTVPTFNVFGSAWKWDWAHIGAFLIPVMSAGQQVASMIISQKMNNSVVTDKNGLYDEETAKKSQSAQTGKTMMYIMPLMSLWIGFTVPAALSLYWLVGGLVRMIEDVILTKHYRKVYDAEDALRQQKAQELAAIEAEKERIRAERRAANPEGITQNTSKKKLQKQQQRDQEAAKAAAAREYAAKKGIELPEEEEKTTLSGVSDRPNCKGRAYDPNRYSNPTEE